MTRIRNVNYNTFLSEETNIYQTINYLRKRYHYIEPNNLGSNSADYVTITEGRVMHIFQDFENEHIIAAKYYGDLSPYLAGSDVLLYDFRLNIGDTVSSYSCGAPDYPTVSSVDYTNVGNGLLLRTFSLSNSSNSPTRTYIGGVGGDYGLKGLDFWKLISLQSDNFN